MGQTTCIRLFQAQRRIGFNTPIFLASANDLMNWQLSGNLNYNVLLAIKAQLYSFNNTRVMQDWNEIHSSSLFLNQFFNDALRNSDATEGGRIRHSFLQRSLGQQFLTSLNQFLMLDNQLLRWGCIKSLYNLSAQGNIPRWFKFFELRLIGSLRMDNGVRKLIAPYNQSVEASSKIILRPIAVFTDRRVKEWVANIRTDGIIIGKIVTKPSFTQCTV